MKKPKTPPDYWELIASMDSDWLSVQKQFPIETDGSYFHWDEVIHRQPPEGLRREQWWAAIKYRRRALHKKLIGMSDKQHHYFRYAEVDPIPERLHEIDLLLGGRTGVAQTVLSSELKDLYLVNSLIEEAVSSSQLEGAVTTRMVARELIRTGRKPTDKSEQMILNNYQTMQEIRKLKDRSLNVTLIWEIHRLITHDTLRNPDEEGRFRKPDEEVDVVDYETGEVLHRPPPFEELGQRMHAIYNLANEIAPDWFMHPVIRSIILHFYLAYVHPFVDGNGRTARGLFYWSMLKHGYELFEYISISHFIQRAKARYYRAFMYTETDENDLTYFIIYHLEVIKKAVEALQDYVNRKSAELAQLERNLQGISALNHRQRALISHALKHPEQKYTIRSHQVSHNVVYETARRDLFNLRDLRLLDAKKKGKTYYFTPAKGLQEKLGSIRP